MASFGRFYLLQGVDLSTLNHRAPYNAIRIRSIYFWRYLYFNIYEQWCSNGTSFQWGFFQWDPLGLLWMGSIERRQSLVDGGQRVSAWCRLVMIDLDNDDWLIARPAVQEHSRPNCQFYVDGTLVSIGVPSRGVVPEQVCLCWTRLEYLYTPGVTAMWQQQQ